ncbi:MAG TPA: SusC/RagA family TonB-linked outer membrane protein [Puia sp.]|nr:SusC/RagA family TonB-linked outer membrane protein [Puia sp.]
MRKFKFLFALLLLASGSWAQTRQFTGSIKDSKSGSPIPSVTIRVKGKNITAVTNTGGAFSLTLPEGPQVLVLSSVGYTTKSVSVEATETNVMLSLDASSDQLGEVVVTALGISKDAKKVGYAVSVVGGDQLTKARESNVALSLAGQVAGLNVHGTSGGAGGSARILVRGMPSMNSGGSPLFVINGVPMDNTQRGAAGEWGGSDNGDGIGNINPDDIETMTVLKGQAASALYGSRATNGVIMITTKAGKKGEANIEYNVNALWDKAVNNTDYQYVYGQGLEGAKPVTAAGAQGSARFAWGSKMDGSSTIQYDGKSYAYSPYKKNIANFYRTGPSLTNTVSVSGGGDRGTYRLSLSNFDNTGIVRNAGLNRKSINLNVMQKVTDKLTATVIANYIDEQDRNRAQLSDGPGNPNNGLFLAPNINENILKPGYDSKGNEVVFSDDNYVTNPWFVVNKFINNTGRKRLISSVTGKYNFTDWLYAQARVGDDLENDRIFQVTPTGTNYSFNSAGQSGQLNGLTNLQTSELNLDGIIGASHHLTEDLNLDATIGINSRTNNYEYEQINGSQFVIPYLYTPSNVLTFGRSYYYFKTEVHSAYYTVDLNYKDFLFLNTTGRYEAYSTLPSSNRSIFTPSVSGGFVFSQLMHSPVLSYGKLRAAFAQTSGSPIGGPNNTQSGAYQDALYYGVANSINSVPVGLLNGASGNVNNLPSLPNLFLKPFVLTETEVGAELKFLNNRLGVDFAYFTRKTKNEIQQATLSQATGYTSTYVGTGSTQNKGMEWQLTGIPIKTADFKWNITFNLTHVTNKILKTDANGNTLTLGTYRPLNANTAFVKGMSGPQIMAHDYTYDSKGNVVVDKSGLPVINTTLTPQGSVLPTTYGGIRNEFTYKNFNLSFLIDYNYGNKILSATSYYTIYRGLNKMTLAGRDAGITTGVTAAGAANTVTASAQDYYQRIAGVSKLNALNGDFIKLRQVTLGYSFTEKVLGNIPLFRSIDVAVVGRNLATFMKHSENIDPEAQFASSVKYAGIEGTGLPFTRTFGVNATFKFKK